MDLADLLLTQARGGRERLIHRFSVNVPVRFAHTVRDAALGRRVTPNELVFTAVSHVLESANAEAA